MAHFAEIDAYGWVKRVLVLPDDQEQRGVSFLRDDLGLGGTWVQTSFTGRIRRRFAAVGMTYDADRDAFILPAPYPTWQLDDQGDWQPPVPRPDGESWLWDESSVQWVERDASLVQSP